MKSLAEELRAASEPPELMELVRGSMEPIQGFILGVSDRLVLLQNFSDRFDLDGYSVVRLAHVTAIQVLSRKVFYLKALQLKGISPRRPEGLDLSEMRALMRSVAEKYPLLVIHRERVAPGECEVGRIKLSSGDFYALRFMSPSATWEDDDRTFPYGDVSRIQFDGEYENTLALVAGSADLDAR